MRSRTRRYAWAGLALALGLSVAGCGSDTEDPSESAQPTVETSAPASDTTESDGATSGDPDLCALLTAEEFESVTGAQPDSPEYDEPIGAMRGMCTWSAEAGFPMVMLGAYPADQRQGTLDIVDSEPVDSLGTEADWTDSAGLLVVVDGADWYLQVVATGEGVAYDRDRSVEVAALVLERL